MAPRVLFTISAEKVLNALGKLAEKNPRIAGRALKREADRIMLRSQEEFVPVDWGTLKGSGETSGPHPGFDGGIYVELRYGGQARAYARAAHEHPGPWDPPSWVNKGTASSDERKAPTEGVVTFHPAGRGPKFLERPMREAAPTMAKRLALDIVTEGWGKGL